MIDASIQYPVMQQKSSAQNITIITHFSAPRHFGQPRPYDVGIGHRCPSLQRGVSGLLAWHPAIWSQNVVPEFGPQIRNMTKT